MAKPMHLACLLFPLILLQVLVLTVPQAKAEAASWSRALAAPTRLPLPHALLDITPVPSSSPSVSAAAAAPPSDVLNQSLLLCKNSTGEISLHPNASSISTLNCSSGVPVGLALGVGARGTAGVPPTVNLTIPNITDSVPTLIPALQNLTCLELWDVNVDGPLLEWLPSLNALQAFTLSNSRFNGTIPEAISTLGLTFLKLYVQEVQVPVSMWTLRSLQYLYLGFIKPILIPQDFSQLTGLSYLYLLRTFLPENLGNLRNLQYLGLDTCFTLTTTSAPTQPEIGLPDLRGLTNLTALDLFGTIMPSDLGSLVGLRRLSIGFFTSLVGGLPQGLGNLTNLTLLQISDSARGFQDSIPASLTGLVSLQYLDLSYNHLVGGIPSNLSALANLGVLFLRGNNLMGTIPSLSSTVTALDLRRNFLWGTIPWPLGHVFYQNTSIVLSANYFSGIANSSEALAAPCNFGPENTVYTALGDVGVLQVPTFEISSNCLPNYSECNISMLSRTANECMAFCDTGVNGTCQGVGICNFYPSSNISRDSFSCTYPSPPPPSPPPPAPPPAPPPPPPAWVIVVPVVLSVLLVLIGLVLFIWLWRQRPLMDLNFKDPRLKALRQFTLSALRKATDNFKSRKLGKGAYGEVFLGKIPETDPLLLGKEVAVKRLILNGKTKAKLQDSAETFLNEAIILAQVQHKNLVKFRGCCLKGNQLYLVVDYAAQGNLRDLLDRDAKPSAGAEDGNQPPPPLDWTSRLGIAQGAAKGISYLHTQVDPAVLHLDIKSANILIDRDYTAKVADFGLSKTREQQADEALQEQQSEEGQQEQEAEEALPEQGETFYTKGWKGTPGYADPAYFSQLFFDRRSDVYSFGVVLLEVATSYLAYDKEVGLHITARVLKSLNDQNFEETAPHAVRQQLGMDISLAQGPHDAPPGGSPQTWLTYKRFLCLGLWCCSADPSERPDMEEVDRTLSSIALGVATMGGEQRVLEAGPS